VDVPLTIPEAVLGGRVSVPTVEGPVTVTVPAGTSSDAKLRLRGKGVKRRDGSRGDQICRLEISVPKNAADDPEVRRLIEELAQKLGPGSPRSY
jgi:DnaJ-class molecular chaperone